MSEVHPFVKLRRAIRQTGKQYRRSNDTSESLFHPDGGFIYAYSISEVEDALNTYEQTLPPHAQETSPVIDLENDVIERANDICKHHTSMDARDFARTVMGYIAMKNSGDKKSKPDLTLLNTEVIPEE